MTINDIIQIAIAMVGSVGGWEAVKYFLNRDTNHRKEEAEADSVEFGVLRDTVEFLQGQLRDKEQRFADQTGLVRQLNEEVLELTKTKGQLELDLQRFKCVVQKCANRMPQNGY